MVRLLEREDALARFDVFHFAGRWFDDNRQLAEAILAAAGRASAPIHAFPWPLIHALSPFNETFREMGEMTYLWRRPLRLLDDKLRQAIGTPPATPLAEALLRTLEGLGRASPPASSTAPERPVAARA